MRRGVVLGVIWALMPLMALAEPVTVSVTALLPEGVEAGPVSWSAVPLDLPEEADVLEAMIMTPEPVNGPWQVVLEPGEYLLSGFTEAELFEAKAVVTTQTTLIEVPVLAIEPAVALRCTEPRCDYTDSETGLRVTLPQGWAVETPYHADLGDGELAEEVSAVFFEDVEGDGGAVWFLNPVDWITGDTGPCRAVAQGNLCSFDLTPAAEAAFAVIAPSLQRVDPPAQ
ncbi:hypothetical protein [Pseudotabrizicola alkalilacus]|uniref:Thiol:disulfide interchange protein DsbD N-terminal domain-containing protein n=1 Tax=Pseudotabrizicola alkalilacus TaxID=2305252 RepID=A0A411Z1M9_9RHOB|nr:hypothetical protein [Pseudotabrizicola alkalilacus]RGP36967.1 hypothetical protein D1012_12525 [Pseudotabrizicola alkalilacus]